MHARLDRINATGRFDMKVLHFSRCRIGFRAPRCRSSWPAHAELLSNHLHTSVTSAQSEATGFFSCGGRGALTALPTARCPDSGSISSIQERRKIAARSPTPLPWRRCAPVLAVVFLRLRADVVVRKVWRWIAQWADSSSRCACSSSPCAIWEGPSAASDTGTRFATGTAPSRHLV
jgi:hypothetical protein